MTLVDGWGEDFFVAVADVLRAEVFLEFGEDVGSGWCKERGSGRKWRVVQEFLFGCDGSVRVWVGICGLRSEKGVFGAGAIGDGSGELW